VRPTGWPKATRSRDRQAPGDLRGDLPSLAGPARGMKADNVKGLKELETENTGLKRIVVDKELQLEALKELG
jgi:hypothetical protein